MKLPWYRGKYLHLVDESLLVKPSLVSLKYSEIWKSISSFQSGTHWPTSEFLEMIFSWPYRFSTLTGAIFCSVDLMRAFTNNKSVWTTAGSTTHKRLSLQSPSIRTHINDSLWGGNFCFSTAPSLLTSHVKRYLHISPFMELHAVLLFCCITDMEIVGPLIVGARICPAVLACFSLTGTLAKMVGSSLVYYVLLVR